jgi:glycosyltransferase involved in cell wall biosynthesis
VSGGSSSSLPALEVVIPTANRPEKLGRCLVALAAAQAQGSFPVLVCDASDEQRRAAVADVCAQHDFVKLRLHEGRNVAAARNACARFATEPLLINVDDDIRVEPDAIARLARAHTTAPPPAVVAGSVAWDGNYSRPVVMRMNGYGRSAREGEAPSFLVGAFFAYPRALALTLPWVEMIRTSDDRLMGALWRSHGVRLGFEPDARATHDHEHVKYDVDEQASHIYANAFDAVIANPSLARALSYEIYGFAIGSRRYARNGADARRYLRAWVRGNRALLRDRRHLRRLVRTQLPGELTAPGGGPDA